MAGENTAVTLTNLFKESYSKEVLKIFPDYTYILKTVKFSGAEKGTGGKFIQPIIMTRENGWTAAAANSGAVTLLDASPMTSARAELLGSQLFGRGALDYEAAARAAKDKASFIDATSLLVENLKESGAFRQEHMFLYGQSGLGVVDAAPTSTTIFKISAATWCPALWAGLEGAPVAVYSSAGTFRAHQTISAVDLDPGSATYRQVTLGGAAAGLVATDIIGFRNHSTTSALSNESQGLHSIMNTSTGTLFGVNVVTYPLWRSTTKAVGGALTITKILEAILQGINRGLKEDVDVLMSPKAWQGLVNPTVDPAATQASRKIDSSYSPGKVEFGTKEIVIHAQGITARLVSHMLVREGDAFVVPMKRLKRVGAQELEFTTPGRGDEIFIHSATLGAYELRCYSNQALFFEYPGKGVYMSGIS